MDDKRGLLALGAYITAATTILVAASWAVFNVSMRNRVPPLPLESTGGLLDTSGGGPMARLNVTAVPSPQNPMDEHRLDVLERMLDEKNTQLRDLNQQLKDARAELNDWKLWYDEIIGATLLGLPTSQAADAGAETPPESTTTPIREPAQLEAELSMAEAVQRQMLADMQALRSELEQARADLADLQLQVLQDSIQAVDQLELEAASAEIVRGLGATAVPGLIRALQSRNPVVRRWAAETLRRLGGEAGTAVTALTEALSDGDRDVRQAAQAALESIER